MMKTAVFGSLALVGCALLWRNSYPERKFGPLLGAGRHGKVYEIAGQEKVVKIQKRPELGCDKKLREEVRIANLAADHGLAPRIHRMKKGFFKSYLFMDRIHGKTIRQQISILKSEESIKELETAVFAAIEKLHDLGIWHGSLHQDNIMAISLPAGEGSKWKIMFIDFEWARVTPGVPLSTCDRISDCYFSHYNNSCSS